MPINFDPENPIDQVYKEMWKQTLLVPGITTLIKSGNVVRFDGNETNPGERTNISSNDFLELALIPAGIQSQLQNTSTTTRFDHSFQWIINSGDWRMNGHINQLHWQLFIAHHRMCDAVYKLTYRQSGTFVKLFSLEDNAIGTVDPGNRAVIPKGWTGLWNVTANMMFNTKDLR
jgi:hypothetical protein